MLQNKFSILQISDLHKLEGTDYVSLLHTLVVDRDRYCQEGVLPPSFIVVCGDVVQGASSETEIRDQYVEVEKFLDGLVSVFLNGERERMIIVPGNHDMNRVASSDSFVDSPNTPVVDYDEFKKHNTDLRWDWRQHKYQRISDYNRYNGRFDLFIEFYNRFFDGIRTYPTDPVMEAYTECFPKENVAFACFNSCCGLDHLNTSASIPEDAIISVASKLINYKNDGYMTIGVWHHHYYGSPFQINYLDKSIFDTMMQFGICLGLFGHQHLSQVAEEITNLYTQDDEEYKKQRMLLISSGTLFGGAKELQPGCKRQYNILDVEMKNGKAEISVHIREDNNPNISSKLPHWGRKFVNSQGFVKNIVYFKHLNENEILVNIDHYVRSSGDYAYGCNAIKNLPNINNRAQDLFDEYLTEVKDYRTLSTIIDHPTTASDFILLISTAIKEDNQKAMKSLTVNMQLMTLCQTDGYLQSQYEDMLNHIK